MRAGGIRRSRVGAEISRTSVHNSRTVAGVWMRISAIALALAAVATAPALGNDSSAELSTGGLIFVRNDSIEMQSEDLAISSKEVNVRYRFLNKSDRDVTI